MALLAAALFGAVIPASRILLFDIGPVTLVGLLYLGAGAGGLLIRRFTNPEGTTESPIRRIDLPWLLGIIAFGSIIGPILCMIGLTTTSASTASLLINAELAFTTLIAVIGFREPLGRRGLYAITAVALGGLILSYDPAGTFGLSAGSLLIILACFCWVRIIILPCNIREKEPAQIVMVKGFVAGIFSVGLGYGNRRNGSS
jgi:drug/metabolite transporter (DMT)-like permease